MTSYPKLLRERLNSKDKSMTCKSAEKLSQLESGNLTLRDENQALNAASHKKRRFRTQVRPIPPLETPNSGTGTNLPTAAPGGEASTREKGKDAQTYDGEDSDSEPEPDKEASDGAARAESPMIAHLHQIFSDRLDTMQSMVERLPGVAPPIRKSNPNFYADTPFTDEITLIEMPKKFSFPSIKAYNGTTDPDDHVAQYRQRMLAVALPKGAREATMCKGFGSTLTGPALQWYINLPSRSIASFAVLSDKFVEQFASSRDL
ncbi:PREDICTED: uncharacterized protein LOC106308554 [Brassica oleracea var. oleracea]|uniref:uncharacterized protein LOC106308554 n=1 Tax=Brassica oleracea var. oleracea TaxID=109376 RepID=UPI0006A73AA4|nr:PREDICTED: uncharacterized protein LOC106308554 [Brassica oleracea var. oleracea]